MSFLLTQYGVEIEIDITPYGDARTWKPLCAGFNNLNLALNEQLQEYYFLCDDGYGRDYKTGIHPKLSLSGVRIVGDAAQDYIFSNCFGLMAEMQTHARYSLANADGTVTRYTFDCTLSNMAPFGGATTDGAAISLDVGMNGKPTVETIAATGTMTVASVAGNTSGTTVLTATPTFPDAGCKYVYGYGESAPTATVGEVLTGWNDFGNGATYTIANGQKVTVAMVNVSTFVVVASGTATVVSKE